MELIIACILGLVACFIGLYLMKENQNLDDYNKVLAGLLDKRTKELRKERESNKFVVPVAEIKAEFSEEDMKKIKELLINTKPRDEKPEEPKEEKKCECNHIYDKVSLEDDVKHCSQRLVFHCAYCNHETIIPIERGRMNDLLRPF